MRNSSGISGPQRGAAIVHNEVAVVLEDEGEVVTATIARGRSNSDAVFVHDKVAVLLEDEAGAVGETEEVVRHSADVEVRKLDDVLSCEEEDGTGGEWAEREKESRANVPIVSDCAIR